MFDVYLNSVNLLLNVRTSSIFHRDRSCRSIANCVISCCVNPVLLSLTVFMLCNNYCVRATQVESTQIHMFLPFRKVQYKYCICGTCACPTKLLHMRYSCLRSKSATCGLCLNNNKSIAYAALGEFG